MSEKLLNFIEYEHVDDVNAFVDLKNYVFLERLSAERGKYCFKIRQRR